jgi:RNA polymerase sigma-70 factor (ECF subfamily)
VLNAARDEGRRRERSRVVSLDEYRESLLSKSSEEQLDERSLIEASLDRIDEPFRTAVLLVDLEGLSYDEAAESLQVATGTIKSRVNRGRLAFRDHWLRLSGASAEELTIGGHS